jgi:opacity protein-like surface antigen
MRQYFKSAVSISVLSVFSAIACFASVKPASAEVVSTKATDLAGTQANNQLTVSQKNDSVAQNTEVSNSENPESDYWYLSSSLGASFPNDVTLTFDDSSSVSIGRDTAFQGNIAAGYQWKQARAELELGHGSYGINSVNFLDESIPASGSVDATTLMVNGYWDIPTGSKWRPYLGAGIGVGFVNAKSENDVEVVNGTALALQGKAGVQYEVTKKGNAFLEVKYQNIGGFSSDSDLGSIDVDSTNSFGVGVGYRQGF